MARELAKLGAREIIVACTHCYQTLTEFLPEFKTRTIYEVLNEVGLPDGASRPGAAIFNIQDACGARQAPQIHAAVRRLVTDLGYGVEEMAHNRERSICCGSGGMVPAVAPELAQKMTDFRLSEATRDLVTYCASCRARLSKAGPSHPARPGPAVQPGLAANQNPAAASQPPALVAALAAEAVISGEL